jgi:hypothetical protein
LTASCGQPRWAVRYFKDQSDMLAARKLISPAFQCSPEENARALKALVDEFFGGHHLVPAASCLLRFSAFRSAFRSIEATARPSH